MTETYRVFKLFFLGILSYSYAGVIFLRMPSATCDLFLWQIQMFSCYQHKHFFLLPGVTQAVLMFQAFSTP